MNESPPQSSSNQPNREKPDDFETVGLRVRCPNCHCPIELVADIEMGSIDCPSCGSNFSLINDNNSTRHALSLKEIGHFKIVERIGAGAFGTVWKAFDTKLDRTVAIKVPRHAQLELSEEEQFLREARSSAQLNHPHIVSVHEVGREGDTIYIVSDLIRGVPLSEMIAESRLSRREAVELTVKLADALHHAHERGVIHRDLKPQNVVVDDAGEPHLMDFGLAKRDVGEVTMTLDGAVLGTPAYMSPEQARGESHRVDQTTDIYSLGVMLFQLLTGELPFRGSPRMMLHKVINDEAPSLRQYNSKTPRDLETIVLKCLEKEALRRYQSSAEVGMELERFLTGKPILARPISAFEKSWRWSRRNSTVAALVGAVVIALVVGIVTSSYFAVRFHDRSKDLAVSKNLAEQKQREAVNERKRAERGFRVIKRFIQNDLQLSEDEALELLDLEDKDLKHLGLQSLRKVIVEKTENILRHDDNFEFTAASGYAADIEPLLGAYLEQAGFGETTVDTNSRSIDRGLGKIACCCNLLVRQFQEPLGEDDIKKHQERILEWNKGHEEKRSKNGIFSRLLSRLKTKEASPTISSLMKPPTYTSKEFRDARKNLADKFRGYGIKSIEVSLLRGGSYWHTCQEKHVPPDPGPLYSEFIDHPKYKEWTRVYPGKLGILKAY